MAEGGISLVPTVACDRAITRLGPGAGIPSYIVDDCARLAPSLERALRLAIELNVTIAAGNDGGAPLTHPGDIVDELAVYVEMGMTPQEALMGATSSAARAIDREGQIGTLAPGSLADVTVIDAPDLNHWLYHFRANACRRVYKSGKPVFQA